MQMQTSASVCAILLLLGCGAASAQSDTGSKRSAAPASKGVGTRALGHDEALRTRMHTWYEDCRKGWDRSTHMTKKDYERTCRRMANERGKFLHDDAKSGTRSR